MRLIRYDSTDVDKELIDKFIEKNQLEKKWLYFFGAYDDVVGLLNIDSVRDYIDLMDIFKHALADGYVGIYDKIIKLRNSFIRLGNTDFVHDLRRENFIYEEKIDVLLQTFKRIMDEVDPNFFNMDGPQELQQEQLKKQEKPQKGKGRSQPKKEETPIDKLADALDQVSSVLETVYRSDETAQKEESDSDEEGDNPDNEGDSPSGNYSLEKHVPASLDLSNNLEAFFQISDWGTMLDLVSTYKHFLDGRDSHKEVPAPVGELKFKKMASFKELKYIRKQDWALPDEVFDAKLAKKEFILERPVHRKKNFNLYVVADISGSMGGIRDIFQRSILLALAEKALETKSKLSVGFFHSDVFPAFKLTTWNSWFQYVMSARLGGCTDIRGALNEAYQVIKDEQLLLITDATATDFPALKSNDPMYAVKKNAVILQGGEKRDGYAMQEFKNYFDNVLVNDTKDLKTAKDVGLRMMAAL